MKVCFFRVSSGYGRPQNVIIGKAILTKEGTYIIRLDTHYGA